MGETKIVPGEFSMAQLFEAIEKEAKRRGYVTSMPEPKHTCDFEEVGILIRKDVHENDDTNAG